MEEETLSKLKYKGRLDIVKYFVQMLQNAVKYPLIVDSRQFIHQLARLLGITSIIPTEEENWRRVLNVIGNPVRPTDPNPRLFKLTTGSPDHVENRSPEEICDTLWEDADVKEVFKDPKTIYLFSFFIDVCKDYAQQLGAVPDSDSDSDSDRTLSDDESYSRFTGTAPRSTIARPAPNTQSSSSNKPAPQTQRTVFRFASTNEKVAIDKGMLVTYIEHAFNLNKDVCCKQGIRAIEARNSEQVTVLRFVCENCSEPLEQVPDIPLVSNDEKEVANVASAGLNVLPKGAKECLKVRTYHDISKVLSSHLRGKAYHINVIFSDKVFKTGIDPPNHRRNKYPSLKLRDADIPPSKSTAQTELALRVATQLMAGNTFARSRQMIRDKLAHITGNSTMKFKFKPSIVEKYQLECNEVDVPLFIGVSCGQQGSNKECGCEPTSLSVATCITSGVPGSHQWKVIDLNVNHVTCAKCASSLLINNTLAHRGGCDGEVTDESAARALFELGYMSMNPVRCNANDSLYLALNLTMNQGMQNASQYFDGVSKVIEECYELTSDQKELIVRIQTASKKVEKVSDDKVRKELKKILKKHSTSMKFADTLLTEVKSHLDVLRVFVESKLTCIGVEGFLRNHPDLALGIQRCKDGIQAAVNHSRNQHSSCTQLCYFRRKELKHVRDLNKLSDEEVTEASMVEYERKTSLMDGFEPNHYSELRRKAYLEAYLKELEQKFGISNATSPFVEFNDEVAVELEEYLVSTFNQGDLVLWLCFHPAASQNSRAGTIWREVRTITREPVPNVPMWTSNVFNRAIVANIGTEAMLKMCNSFLGIGRRGKGASKLTGQKRNKLSDAKGETAKIPKCSVTTALGDATNLNR